MSKTESSIQIPSVPLPNKVQVTLTGDALLVVGLLSWLIWDRLIRNRIVSKLDGAFAPIEEERALNNILAQIGVITNASRVVLAAFHNGAIDSGGYHLTKLSTINSYTAPNHLPMAIPIRDLPVGRIMFELEALLGTQGAENWLITEYNDSLPQPCKDHLKKNNIQRMYNRLIRVGNLPIGILSLQYDETERRVSFINEPSNAKILEDLYMQISQIMRRRIVHPGPIRRLWMRVRGSSPTNPPR